ncbi:MAG: hypothetical protein Q9178_006665 [Gyalolechia marmorata]
MTRAEIIGTSRAILAAGAETTATLLSAATYYLLEQNPDMLHRVQSEVRTAFKTGDQITLRAVSKPGLLPYLEAVLQESLRCFPPIPTSLPRKVGGAGALIDGYSVPKNVSVGVHQWSTYRSSTNFVDPDKFDPERWLPERPAKYRSENKAALQPFALGPKGCIGKGLAYFEMRSILARMLWHLDMQLEDESRAWTEQKEYATWDKPPLWIRLKHRADNLGPTSNIRNVSALAKLLEKSIQFHTPCPQDEGDGSLIKKFYKDCKPFEVLLECQGCTLDKIVVNLYAEHQDLLDHPLRPATFQRHMERLHRLISYLQQFEGRYNCQDEILAKVVQSGRPQRTMKARVPGSGNAMGPQPPDYTLLDPRSSSVAKQTSEEPIKQSAGAQPNVAKNQEGWNMVGATEGGYDTVSIERGGMQRVKHPKHEHDIDGADWDFCG